MSDPSLWTEGLALAKRQMLAPPTVAVGIGASLLCAAVGPFTTYMVDEFLSRLVFWTLVVFASVVLSCLINGFVQTVWADRGFWTRALITGATFSILYVAFLEVLIAMFYGAENTPPILILFGVVALVTSIVNMVIWSFQKMISEVSTPLDVIAPSKPPLPEALSPNGRPDFLGDTPPEDLIRLAMHDHYVEVHTTSGQTMVHKRFSDALAALDPAIGVQTHRSHWVAFAHIKDVTREDGKVGFLLSDGSEVPVARSKRADLKERGLL